MSIFRKIVSLGKRTSSYFAYGLQNDYYRRILFNKELHHGFVGVNDPLSEEYKKQILDLWKKKYGVKVDLGWFSHYVHCYGEESPYYIPDNIFHGIIEPYFNKDEYIKCMSNKNYFENWLPGLKHVHTLAKLIQGVWYDNDFHLLSVQDVVDILAQHSEFVAKPSVESAGGAGVLFITEKVDAAKLTELQKSFPSDFVIQEVFRQHPDMNEIYPHSVNTVRVMSLNFHGKVRILSSLLRMGANGNRVDNMVSGGVNCAILPDGSLCNKLYNAIGTRFDGHPNTGSVEGKKVPNFSAVLDAVENAHKCLPYMGIISWDFAIGEDAQPVLVEFNLKPQGLDLHQRENGPIFGDLTEAVLDEVFLGKKQV